jgi:hypothetical protein
LQILLGKKRHGFVQFPFKLWQQLCSFFCCVQQVSMLMLQPNLSKCQFCNPDLKVIGVLQQLNGQQTEKEVEKPVRHPKLVTMCWKGSASVEQGGSTMQQQDGVIVVRLPLPYALPPTKYRPEGKMPSKCFW